MKMQDMDKPVEGSKDVKGKGKVDVVKNKKTSATENLWKIDGLPSGYKFYPEGSELLGRPLQVLDVKYLSSMNETNYNTIINEVVRRCTTGMDVNDLLVADKLYTIFWLRANTYKESGYSVDFKCPKCKVTSDYNFSLDCLDIISVPDKYDPEKEIEIPNSQDSFQLNYLRVNDELFIEEFVQKRETQLAKFDREVLQIAQAITINGQKWDLAKKYQYLVNLHPSQYSFIESYAKHIDIGISPVMNVKCNKCGGSAQIGVTFSGDFFVPEYKFE